MGRRFLERGRRCKTPNSQHRGCITFPRLIAIPLKELTGYMGTPPRSWATPATLRQIRGWCFAATIDI
jgi:hypothetical protein